MPRPIFQAFLALPSQKTAEQPSWATHVIESNHDTDDEGQKKLFWALYDKTADNGKGEYRLGPDTFGRFHPDGYTVFDTVPFKRVANIRSETATEESQFVGQKWWIKNGAKGELIQIVITYLTDKVITIETCETAVVKTFLRERIEFIERAPD